MQIDSFVDTSASMEDEALLELTHPFTTRNRHFLPEQNHKETPVERSDSGKQIGFGVLNIVRLHGNLICSATKEIDNYTSEGTITIKG